LIEFTRQYLCRVYPKGSRIDSSNYAPQESWNSGCQIVALNYQTGSHPMWLNVGKFLDNGGSGYVLKPSFLRTPNSSFDPLEKRKVTRTLTIQIISGWLLPKTTGESKKGDVVDPYVKMYLFGVPQDQKKEKTKVFQNNGFHPVWKEEFKFQISVVELANLLFVVADKQVKGWGFIGQFALPVSTIKSGFRSIPLRNQQGQYFADSTLFVKIDINQN